MHKKFEINQTKIKGSCQSGRKVVTNDSKSDLPLEKNIQKENPDFFLDIFRWIYNRQRMGTYCIWFHKLIGSSTATYKYVKYKSLKIYCSSFLLQPTS